MWWIGKVSLMGYLSDWQEAEEHAAAVEAAHPNCDRTADCTAGEGGHILTCIAYRRKRRAGHPPNHFRDCSPYFGCPEPVEKSDG